MNKTLKMSAIALVLLGGTAVLAQSRDGALYDPAQLPETKGVVKQYTLSPRGDVDGLLLNDGTEVQLPPHLAAQTVFVARPGDAVTIRGLKARALPMIAAVTVTNDKSGAVVADQGRPDDRRNTAAEIINGKVASLLHGRRGELNGVVLEDGAQLRIPPHEAERYGDLLQTGKAISVRGTRLTTALGTVIDAEAIGATADKLTELDQPKHGPRGPKGPKGHRGEDGPDRDPPPPPPRG